jgi:hypothetical protein
MSAGIGKRYGIHRLKGLRQRGMNSTSTTVIFRQSLPMLSCDYAGLDESDAGLEQVREMSLGRFVHSLMLCATWFGCQKIFYAGLHPRSTKQLERASSPESRSSHALHPLTTYDVTGNLPNFRLEFERNIPTALSPQDSVRCSTRGITEDRSAWPCV